MLKNNKLTKLVVAALIALALVSTPLVTSTAYADDCPGSASGTCGGG